MRSAGLSSLFCLSACLVICCAFFVTPGLKLPYVDDVHRQKTNRFFFSSCLALPAVFCLAPSSLSRKVRLPDMEFYMNLADWPFRFGGAQPSLAVREQLERERRSKAAAAAEAAAAAAAAGGAEAAVADGILAVAAAAAVSSPPLPV